MTHRPLPSPSPSPPPPPAALVAGRDRRHADAQAVPVTFSVHRLRDMAVRAGGRGEPPTADAGSFERFNLRFWYFEAGGTQPPRLCAWSQGPGTRTPSTWRRRQADCIEFYDKRRQLAAQPLDPIFSFLTTTEGCFAKKFQSAGRGTEAASSTLWRTAVVHGRARCGARMQEGRDARRGYGRERVTGGGP